MACHASHREHERHWPGSNRIEHRGVCTNLCESSTPHGPRSLGAVLCFRAVCDPFHTICGGSYVAERGIFAEKRKEKWVEFSAKLYTGHFNNFRPWDYGNLSGVESLTNASALVSKRCSTSMPISSVVADTRALVAAIEKLAMSKISELTSQAQRTRRLARPVPVCGKVVVCRTGRDSRSGSLHRMVRSFLFRLSIMRGVRATLLPVRGQPPAIKLSPGLLVHGGPAPSFEASGY